MPIKALHVVKKIVFAVASKLKTKRQIVAEVKDTAAEHRVINQRQEHEDTLRVEHAVDELEKETRT